MLQRLGDKFLLITMELKLRNKTFVFLLSKNKRLLEIVRNLFISKVFAFLEHFCNNCFEVCQIIPATLLFQSCWLFIVPSRLRFSWFFICQVILNCILIYYETLGLA